MTWREKEFPKDFGSQTYPEQQFIPGTEIPVEWNPHHAFAQQRMFMPTELFLKLSGPPMGGFSLTSLKTIKDGIAKGNPMTNLELEVDVDRMKVTNHEGRHRAYWAYKKGIKYVPVTIIHRKRYEFPDGGKYLRDTEVTQQIDPYKLKPESDVTAWDYAVKDWIYDPDSVGFHPQGTIDEIREGIIEKNLAKGLNWIIVVNHIPQLQVPTDKAIEYANYYESEIRKSFEEAIEPEIQEEMAKIRFKNLLDGKDYSLEEMVNYGKIEFRGQIKYPEPLEGWEARRPSKEGEAELTRGRIEEREREIILKVESIVYPIIEDECNHLGIIAPRIEWVTSLMVRGREHKGGYHHGAGKRILYQNTQTITTMFEDGKSEQETIARVVRSCFHEFSHYVDEVYHKASMGDIAKNYKYYETRADEYAEELMPPKIEVVYGQDEKREWVREIEEEQEQQKKAIEAFIDLTLKEYSAKTGYPVPKVEWMPTLIVISGVIHAGYDPKSKTILINEDFIRESWARVSGREDVIRLILAEEFWHSVQDAKGEIPDTYEHYEPIILKLEKEARQKAVELSGISEEAARHLGWIRGQLLLTKRAAFKECGIFGQGVVSDRIKAFNEDPYR